MDYGLIGHPLAHSFSAEIHSLIGDYNYEIVDLRPEDIPDFFLKKSFKGINVTIPYKQSVIKYLDCLSDDAKDIGSVNTIVNKNGKLYGYNTDINGFEDLLNENAIEVLGKKVLILGSGGSSATATSYCKKKKALNIKVVSRSASADTITYEDALRYFNDAEIIINTTPIGMFPDSFSVPIDINFFNNLKNVIDIVYNPLKTALSSCAERRGIDTCNGLYMLVSQAVHSSALFFDDNSNLDKINNIYKLVVKSKQNIVFIGMPASGKSTIGKLIAEYFNFDFYDSDLVIQNKTNHTISEIFQNEGEQYFRAIESDVISELSKHTSSVIATGGGVVLNPTNIVKLRQNGIIIFLDRLPRLLSFDNSRPLIASKIDIDALYRHRIDFYREAADVIVDNNGSITEVFNKLKEILNDENLCD